MINLRQYIVEYLKENPKVHTRLGEISLEYKLLGEGGTSLVYSSICGRYAIKFLVENIRGGKNSQIYLRFKQEFANLFELSKREKRIAEILDDGSVQIVSKPGSSESLYEIPFIVLKKYSGSLKTCERRVDSESINILDNFFCELSSLVEIIHSENIIHRDIKPGNIFLDENNRLILGDFGIAWFDKSVYQKLAKTKRTDRLANFDFSAPEQFKPGTSAAFTMDLFAVGQMLQWYATGETVKGLGTTKLSELLGPSFFYYDVIIERLVQANPMNRPQSVRELLEMWESEKTNSHRKWLLYSNINYRKLVSIVEDWIGASEIPIEVTAKALLTELNEELTKNELLFLISSAFSRGAWPGFINLNWIDDLRSYVNFYNEDIFENFEVDFSRIDQHGNSFRFVSINRDVFSISSDNFRLYPFSRQEFKHPSHCIYSEITNRDSNEKYLLLVLNDTKLTYRLRKLK